MKLKALLIVTLFLITSCKSQSASPTVVPIALPSKTPVATATAVPTETLLPTETPSPLPTPSDVFGVIPLNSVQVFDVESLAEAIFKPALQGYVDAGLIQEYKDVNASVFPSSDGVLIAEIMYSIRAEADPWPDDFGTSGVDGWINGKCSRFDLVATDTEHQLKNKRLCS